MFSSHHSTPTPTPTPTLVPAWLGLLLAVMLSGCGGADSGTPYTPPALGADSDGKSLYVNAPMIDGSKAAALDPVLDSPEAAVVKFLASRVRGDQKWRAAMVAKPSDRTNRALSEWDEWTLTRFQLRGRQDSGPDSVWVTVHFEITFDGRSDGGEDEFEVGREDGGWRVIRPPS